MTCCIECTSLAFAQSAPWLSLLSPQVDTSFLPDREREGAERTRRDELRLEWMETQVRTNRDWRGERLDAGQLRCMPCSAVLLAAISRHGAVGHAPL